MGFCWSGECSSRSCWAGGRMSRSAGWVGPTALLCIYGFSSMMRPIQPFMTEFLTGTYKNLSTEQVTRQVYPVWTYSNLVLLIPVVLVTDFLRYKPVIILQGVTYVTTFLLVLFGSGLRSAQLAFFCYSIAMAADVAYFSYIYTVVQPSYYQRVTSYVRGAVLLGSAVGDLLAQLLVSSGGVSLYCLTFLTLTSVSVALITSCCLPMPHISSYPVQQINSGPDTQEFERQDFIARVKSASEVVGRKLGRLGLDYKTCYSSVPMVFLCIWAATGRCGFYQVTSYVQLLWVHVQPSNFTAYNGGVEAISTVSGAAATVAVGHVSLEWSVWGELVLGGFTFLIAGAILLLGLTNNIWISYTCFTIFKAIYLPLITICTFQIAERLNRRRYALVLGTNSFVGTVLQSVLTAIIINTKTLKLSIQEQFLIYASYFAAISLLFSVRGLYTVLHRKRPTGGNQAEKTNQTTGGLTSVGTLRDA